MKPTQLYDPTVYYEGAVIGEISILEFNISVNVSKMQNVRQKVDQVMAFYLLAWKSYTILNSYKSKYCTLFTACM